MISKIWVAVFCTCGVPQLIARDWYCTRWEWARPTAPRWSNAKNYHIRISLSSRPPLPYRSDRKKWPICHECLRFPWRLMLWTYILIQFSWNRWLPSRIFPHYIYWKGFAWDICWWSWALSLFLCNTFCRWENWATTTIQSLCRNGCFRIRSGSSFVKSLYGLSICRLCLLFLCCCQAGQRRKRPCLPLCGWCSKGLNLNSFPIEFCSSALKCPCLRWNRGVCARFTELSSRIYWDRADDMIIIVVRKALQFILQKE